MPEVIIHDDESFERALKRFKKKCEKAGILSDLRKHRHFEKPSEKRKRKMSAASARAGVVLVSPESSLNATLRAALNAARKAQDKERTLVLGTILANLKNREIELRRPATDDEVVDVLRKGIKIRREAIEQYSATRPDLAANEASQIKVLEEFLPPAADPEEIRAAVRQAIAGGAKDIGKVMGQVLPQYKGKADGKLINQIVREELQAG